MTAFGDSSPDDRDLMRRAVNACREAQELCNLVAAMVTDLHRTQEEARRLRAVPMRALRTRTDGDE